MESSNIFGYVAIGLSSLFYCTLVIPFLNVLRCKVNYEFTPIGLIDTVYIDSIAWYIYGDRILCDQLKLCNTIGCCCSLALIVIYLAFELKKYLVDSILNCLILILGTLVLHKGLSVVVDEPQNVGRLCICTKFISCFVILFMTYRIIKEKNFKLISFNTTFTYLLACIGWALFGKTISDTNVMIANGIGILCCITQILLYLNFKKKYPYYTTNSTIGIENTSTEESKKEETSTMSIDEEKEEKTKEKPVKIITRVDN